MRRRSAADLRRNRRLHQDGRRRRFLPAVQGLESRRLMTAGVPPIAADLGFEAFSVGSGLTAYGKPNTPQPQGQRTSKQNAVPVNAWVYIIKPTKHGLQTRIIRALSNPLTCAC